MSMDSFTAVQSHCRKPSSFANACLALSVIPLGILLIVSCDLSYTSCSQLSRPNATYIQISLHTGAISLNFLPHLTAQLLIY